MPAGLVSVCWAIGLKAAGHLAFSGSVAKYASDADQDAT